MNNPHNFPDSNYLLSSAISLKITDSNKKITQITSKYTQQINDIWDIEQKKRLHQLNNNKILNLDLLEYKGSQIILNCSPVEYKQYLAQRAGIPLGITPLGVSGIVSHHVDSNEYIFIGERSQSVTQYPSHYEFIPSGSIDVCLQKLESINFKNQISQELFEELGVDKKDIISCNEFCLIYDNNDNVYDIGIHVSISLQENIEKSRLEYQSIEQYTISQIGKIFTEKPVVPTSHLLLQAYLNYK